jgi:bifunctional NMN adenylyltransferase/nudix hydrolase
MKKIGVFIGRFQPFHLGHKAVVNQAIEDGINKLIIIVGSAYSFKTFKDPFSYTVRQKLIELSLQDIDNNKFSIHPMEDYEEDYEWVNKITTIVLNTLEEEKEYNVTLYGYRKDASSYYLNLFPDWGYREVLNKDNINATDIRKSMYEFKWDDIKDKLYKDCYNYFSIKNEISDNEDEIFPITEFIRLQREYEQHIQFKHKWSNTPHEVQFITVDALILTQGHIVLIERDQFPCKGALSLIGGFVNSNERLLQGAIRITQEKTGIKLSKNNMINQTFRDKPNRSLRGRTLTHAFLFEIQQSLAKWKGIKLIPINEIERYKHQMFEDHFFIVKNLLRNI